MYSSCHITLPLAGHTALKPAQTCITRIKCCCLLVSISSTSMFTSSLQPHTSALAGAGQWWGGQRGPWMLLLVIASVSMSPLTLPTSSASLTRVPASRATQHLHRIVLAWYHGATATSLQHHCNSKTKIACTLTFHNCLNINYRNSAVLCAGSVEFKPKLAKCPCPCLCQCGRECQLAKSPGASHTSELAKRRASDYSRQMPNLIFITDPFI